MFSTLFLLVTSAGASSLLSSPLTQEGVLAVLEDAESSPRESFPLFEGKRVHPLRLKQIEEINAKKSTWTATVNERFALQAPGASKSMNGVKLAEQSMAKQASLMRGEMEIFRATDPSLEIPESFDAAEKWPECASIITDIRDQSNCGCCWAFGGVEAASDRLCIATKGETVVPLSAQDVCFNANKNGCNGGQIITPFAYLKTKGVVSGGQYQDSGPFGADGLCSDFSLPHCHHHGPVNEDPYPAEGAEGCPSQRSPAGPSSCDADVAATNSVHAVFQADKYFADAFAVASGEEQIQRFIMESGPVETAFTVYDDFEDYAGGVYQHLTGNNAGGHAVKFVGWGVDQATGTKYWKVANSWNPYWGEDGYFRILRGVNECGIENEVTATATNAIWSWASVPEATLNKF
mmetsp:Transcript_15614/g.51092  ORF Transcript_15614/g.51092 Transcript_15614/m.51092 type:complete len:406 (-) Transcript_15614:2724-3941(-)